MTAEDRTGGSVSGVGEGAGAAWEDSETGARGARSPKEGAKAAVAAAAASWTDWPEDTWGWVADCAEGAAGEETATGEETDWVGATGVASHREAGVEGVKGTV